MTENDTAVWMDVPSAELCLNHVGLKVRVTGPYTVEGKLLGLHITVQGIQPIVEAVVLLDETRAAQIQFSGTETVQVLITRDDK